MSDVASLLSELHALVLGESPSLLVGESCAEQPLDMRIRAALALQSDDEEPTSKCYLQENDPPEQHDLATYSAVCGRCYEALHYVLGTEIEGLKRERDQWRESYCQAMEQHGFKREDLSENPPARKA